MENQLLSELTDLEIAEIIAEEISSVLEKKKKKKKKKKSSGKKDACYYKVKSRYKVWPSAYASGALVKCRKVGAKNWGTGGKKNEELEINEEDLTDSEETDLKKIKKQLSKSAKKHARQAKQATDIAKASAKSSELHTKQVQKLKGMIDEAAASRSYCENTPCDEMGFTQKASCKSQGIKDCYKGKKKK